ncbi:MAG: hypothetical protein ACFFDI_30450, partial [Promethearchaeota archaeon]
MRKRLILDTDLVINYLYKFGPGHEVILRVIEKCEELEIVSCPKIIVLLYEELCEGKGMPPQYAHMFIRNFIADLEVKNKLFLLEYEEMHLDVEMSCNYRCFCEFAAKEKVNYLVTYDYSWVVPVKEIMKSAHNVDIVSSGEFLQLEGRYQGWNRLQSLVKLSEDSYKEKIDSDEIKNIISEISTKQTLPERSLSDFILKQFANNKERLIALRIIENLRIVDECETQRITAKVAELIFALRSKYRTQPIIGVIEGEKTDKSGIIYRYLLKMTKLHYLRLEEFVNRSKKIRNGNETPIYNLKKGSLVIFIDDCIGTGKQASEYLKKFIHIYKTNEFKVYFIAYYGYKTGIEKLEQDVGNDVGIMVMVPVPDNSRVLSPGFI